MTVLPVPVDDSQERVLRAYTILRLLREDWGGALIVCCGLGPQGAALAMAANIAGAVCLSIEDRPELLKAAGRTGSCDFIVNTLDEALRAMKNEARKHLPISVGLQADPLMALQEIVERGVQPELFTSLDSSEPKPDAYRKAVQQLQAQGALVADFDGTAPRSEAVDATAILDRHLADRQWALHSFSLASAPALRDFDARAFALLPEDDALRRQWLRGASRIVQRERPLRRVLWLTPLEHGTLHC